VVLRSVSKQGILSCALGHGSRPIILYKATFLFFENPAKNSDAKCYIHM
jgi:hypothetical protein